MKRDSFLFYRSFMEALEDLNDKQYAKVMRAITKFALDGEEIALSGVEKVIFTLTKPQIIANNKRYENGCRGGRNSTKEEAKQVQDETELQPNENQTVTKTKPNYNQDETNLTPNENENVNDNVNVKDNNKKVSKKDIEINNNTHAHVRKSYAEVMDDFGVTDDSVRQALFRFIQHLQANGIVIVNDRLERIIYKLDFKYDDDVEKIKEIDQAIISGYRYLPCEGVA